MLTKLAVSLLLAVGVQTTIAQSMQDGYYMKVQYYSDQKCSQYLDTVYINKTQLDTCTSYNVPNAGSFNVADCYSGKQYSGCHCTWYALDGCQVGALDFAGRLYNGSALNTDIFNPSAFMIGDCASTSVTLASPLSFVCKAGWYL